VSRIDLTGLRIPLPDGGTESFGPRSRIFACDILEVTPSGFVTWAWSATDHFDPVKDFTYLASDSVGPGSVVDPFHCNSIAIDANENLLVSARQMDSVFYVERPSGKVLWKMGGASATKDNATYIPVADPFYRQHDARFQPSWSYACGGGQISMFDDETGLPGPGRAVVYDVTVPRPADGGATDCETVAHSGGRTGIGATVAWQYKGEVSPAGGGSFRILPDGSRTIDWGLSGTMVVFSEVDAEGHDLFDLKTPRRRPSYRAIKVPLTQFDLDVLRATAGGSPGAAGAGVGDSGVDAEVEESGLDAEIGEGGADAGVPEGAADAEAGEGGGNPGVSEGGVDGDAAESGADR
jgi:hypothetical protein